MFSSHQKIDIINILMIIVIISSIIIIIINLLYKNKKEKFSNQYPDLQQCDTPCNVGWVCNKGKTRYKCNQGNWIFDSEIVTD